MDAKTKILSKKTNSYETMPAVLQNVARESLAALWFLDDSSEPFTYFIEVAHSFTLDVSVWLYTWSSTNILLELDSFGRKVCCSIYKRGVFFVMILITSTITLLNTPKLQRTLSLIWDLSNRKTLSYEHFWQSIHFQYIFVALICPWLLYDRCSNLRLFSLFPIAIIQCQGCILNVLSRSSLYAFFFNFQSLWFETPSYLTVPSALK